MAQDGQRICPEPPGSWLGMKLAEEDDALPGVFESKKCFVEMEMIYKFFIKEHTVQTTGGNDGQAHAWLHRMFSPYDLSGTAWG